MTRAVRQINIARDRHEDARPRPFSDFSDAPNIILLGDPGAGKTYLFRESALAEQARFITARAFLTMPAGMLRGQALFIDGLDEKRAGRGDRETVDAVVAKLFEVAPSKVRISCRVADWLGESDLAAMAPYFDQQAGACVLHLESLSRPEQIDVLAGQRVEAGAAADFLEEAGVRGLADFLDNPQNLIMLWRAVQTGSWPSTRKQLFELSTELMLQEPNAERARSGVGTILASELRPVAGAVCAARLISDVEAISLMDQEGTAEIPGYRSMNLFSPELVQAALGRRIFDAASQPETVDYAHRTTAEYLAAEFLASCVRAGLPFGRVAALMGVEGHPASELRGLHAWLAVYLPEHADALIEADPYGVLTYGDAASLSTSSCTVLVRALDRLSQTNPWFRSGAWQARSIGGLARADMIGEFRAILNNPASGFGVRSVVVDALALGQPLPAMVPGLQAVLARHASPFAERVRTLDALLRLGDAGKTAIRAVFDAQLGNSENDLRLRAAILQALYGDPYGPQEVIALVHQAVLCSDSTMTGVLWGLADKLPAADLPEILDGIEPPASDAPPNNQRGWEAGSFYARILVRVWPHAGAAKSDRVLRWLHKRLAFRGGFGESRARGLRAEIQATSERLHALAEHFFKNVPMDNQRWLALNRFREATLFELSPEALSDIAGHALELESDSDRRLFLYEVAFGQTFQMAFPQAGARFDALYQRAEADPGLRALRDEVVVTKLPDNYFAGRSARTSDDGKNRARQQQDFDRDIDLIRSGAHLGWLKHMAFIYFALYSDTDGNLLPRNRIAAWLGEERVDAALESLAATLSRNDLPGFNDVMALAANHQHYDWWYAALAGLNERFASGQGFDGLPDDVLKGLAVFDITGSLTEPPWRKALIERRPELVRDAYLGVVQLRLSRGEQIVEGLRELLQESAFDAYRPALVMDLLRQFPNADPFKLGELLDAVAALPSIHQDYLQLAASVISGTLAVDERQRDLWLVTAYLIAPATYENTVLQRATARPGLVFDLRDHSGFARRALPDHMLPLPMLEFMATLTGRLFPSTPHPVGGWSGDTNAWDASEHFRTLINRISTSPTPAATDALQRLEGDPQLASYRPDVLFALANQRQRRRDTEYDRPDWPKTVAALANRAPATIADFHALLVAQLRDLAHRIARANTDIFKQFWNLDGYARITEPRPEEACRDDVITLLKPVLNPLGIMVEPEGHMVADKRADISAAMPGRKILCELKRDYHAEVWTAMTGQLERFYAHDPEAKGFGIYVVFWFGAKRPTNIPAPLNGMPRPKTAAEIEAMLQALLPADMRKRLAVIVIDVSGQV